LPECDRRLPGGFRNSVLRERAALILTKSLARYFLSTLALRNSIQVPGQDGQPSLLHSLLIKDVQLLTKENASGFGWQPLRNIGHGGYGTVIFWEKKRRNLSPLRLAVKDSSP